MKKTSRILLRAASSLEREARELVESAQDDPENSGYWGKRAAKYFAIAYGLRELQATGNMAANEDRKAAGSGMLSHYRAIAEKARAKRKPPAAGGEQKEGSK